MKKRILSFLLACVLLIGLLPGLATKASAAPAADAGYQYASEECINILKYMEGFSAKPFYDYGQYSVGYGSACKKTDYPNGITEEEADALLRENVDKFELALNVFIAKNNLKLSQNQFDALLLFTYNCGQRWTTEVSNFSRAVVEGDKGNDFIFAMVQWSTADGELLPGLVNRRLIEADMYLNGNYTNEVPAHYSYVTFVRPEGMECEIRVQGYDASNPTKVIAQPTMEGNQFLGWYTQEVGGKWVTDLDATTTAKPLYAHWQPDTVAPDADGNVTGVAASYERTVSADAGTKAYAKPDTASEEKAVLQKDTKVAVKADYQDKNGIKWGKLSDGTWIVLSDTAAILSTITSSAPVGVKVKVLEDKLNVRAAAGDKYAKIRTAEKGEVLSVYRTVIVNGGRWGKTSGGWIYLPLTDYDAVIAGGTSADKAIAEGTVKAAGSLNIRSGPGTTFATEGALASGQKVYITEIRNVGGVEWGKIQNGWICLTYVNVKSLTEEPEKPSEPEKPEEPEKPSEPEKPEEPEKPSEPEKPEEPSVPENAVTGKVKCNTYLLIRAKAGQQYKAVGSLSNGTKVTILERVAANGLEWGKIDKGWICMKYVELDKPAAEPEKPEEKPSEPEKPAEPETPSEPEKPAETKTTGKVQCNTYLNIRSGAGTGNKSVGKYANGTKVTILEQTTVGGKKWGKTDKGWICMDYVKLDTAGTTTPGTGSGNTETTPGTGSGNTETTPGTGTATPTTGTVKCNSVLLIRSDAGTNHKIVGKLKNGDKVTILSKKVVGGNIWGQITDGWICLVYVKLDTANSGTTQQPETGNKPEAEKPEDKPAEQPFTGTVTASGLYIRTGAGTNKTILGYYVKGAQVTILETTKVGDIQWGRTDKGWISLAYVK